MVKVVNFMSCVFYDNKNNSNNKVGGGFKDVCKEQCSWPLVGENAEAGGGTLRPSLAGALALRCARPTVPGCASPVLWFLTGPPLISFHGFLLMFRHGSPERGALSMKSSLESWPCLKQTKVKENKIYFQGEAKTMFAVTSGIK